MGKCILVTGGSRSGKSTFAENLLASKEEVLYIATAKVTDGEMEDRIKKHQSRRNAKWTTYEGYKDLHKVIRELPHDSIMLDCVTIMITNLLFEKERDFDHITMEEVNEVEQEIKAQFTEFLTTAKALQKEVVLVTNEVGYGLVPEYKLSRIFRDIAGSMNQHIASLCDEVYLVACGLPLKLK